MATDDYKYAHMVYLSHVYCHRPCPWNPVVSSHHQVVSHCCSCPVMLPSVSRNISSWLWSLSESPWHCLWQAWVSLCHLECLCGRDKSIMSARQCGWATVSPSMCQNMVSTHSTHLVWTTNQSHAANCGDIQGGKVMTRSLGRPSRTEESCWVETSKC